VRNIGRIADDIMQALHGEQVANDGLSGLAQREAMTGATIDGFTQGQLLQVMSATIGASKAQYHAK
jgi:hypothetical protein